MKSARFEKNIAFCLVFILMWAQAAVAKEKVYSVCVDKAPPVVQHRYFNLARPPLDLPPLRRGEKGTTLAKYGQVFNFSIELISSKREDHEHVVVVSPTSADVKLSLPISIWLPQSAPAKLIRHEEGHKLIHQSIYEDADKLMRFYASGMGSCRYEGRGADFNQALKNAYQLIGEDLSGIYQRYVYDFSVSVGDEYDRITRHGSNKVPEDEAIEKAFQKYAAYKNQIELVNEYLELQSNKSKQKTDSRKKSRHGKKK